MFIVLGWRMEDVHVSSFEAEHTRKLLSPDKLTGSIIIS